MIGMFLEGIFGAVLLVCVFIGWYVRSIIFGVSLLSIVETESERLSGVWRLAKGRRYRFRHSSTATADAPCKKDGLPLHFAPGLESGKNFYA